MQTTTTLPKIYGPISAPGQPDTADARPQKPLSPEARSLLATRAEAEAELRTGSAGDKMLFVIFGAVAAAAVWYMADALKLFGGGWSNFVELVRNWMS